WGKSNAATIRHLLRDATSGMTDRQGHTCNERQFNVYGTSNPRAKERCLVCWPEDVDFDTQHQYELKRIHLLGTWSKEYLALMGWKRAPTWWALLDHDRQAAVDNDGLDGEE
ncbi:MAG: hypothetical protein ACPGGE_00565, partial [Poseidonia sp.]